MAAVDRWYVRCRDCQTVAAITERPNIHEMRCGLCSGSIENMGRVERHRLVHDESQSVCDDRCTHARGPLCDCKCGGKNHGSRAVVQVTRDAGPVPILVMPDNWKAKRAAEEYRAARAAVLARLDPLITARQRRDFLADRDFRALHAMRRALSKAHEARTHETRMRALRDLLPRGWTFASSLPDPSIAAFAATLNPSGGALAAEVAFSLSPIPFRPTEIQRNLFD